MSSRRLPSLCASWLPARALLVVLCACLAAACDMGNKPEPPYKDPPPNQRIKSEQRVLMVLDSPGSPHLAAF